MASPWSFSFAFGDEGSDSEDDTVANVNPRVAQGVPFGQAAVEKQISDDTRLALEIDLSTRNDTAVFRKTPWTVAKANAASRPTRRTVETTDPPVSSPANPHHANSMTLAINRKPKGSVIKSKSLTGHFKREHKKQDSLPKRTSKGKEKLGSRTGPLQEKPIVQELARNTAPLTKGDTYIEDTHPGLEKEPQTPPKRAFISPFKLVPQPPRSIPKKPLSHKRSVRSEARGTQSDPAFSSGISVLADFPAPKVPAPVVAIPCKFVPPISATPDRPTVKHESLTPSVKQETLTENVKKAGNHFLASAPLVHTSPVKRKREPSPSDLLPTYPTNAEYTSSFMKKRPRKDEPSPPLPVKQVRSPTRRGYGASAYSNSMLESGNDDSWSTLQVKKKAPPPNIKTSSSSRFTTRGFRLPATFLGVLREFGDARGENRPPRRTLLTLYQPPSPFPSSRPRAHLEKEMQSGSEPSEESGSGESGGSDDNDDRSRFWGRRGVGQDNGRFRGMNADSDVLRSGEAMTMAQDSDEMKEDFGMTASVDPAALKNGFPMFTRKLREQ